MALAVLGGRPGEGGRGQGSLGPRRGGEWGRKPSPKSRVCVHFLLLRYIRGPCQCPPPPDPPPVHPRPELQTRHFGAARKTRVAGPRRGGIPDPQGNCKTQKVGRALLRQKWQTEPTLRGQRRRCPIKTNGPSRIRPYAGTGGCKRCAELLVCCKGAVRTTGDTATRGSEGRVESRRRGRCRVCPCVWGTATPMNSRDFRETGGVSAHGCGWALLDPLHRPDPTAHRPWPACVPES